MVTNARGSRMLATSGARLGPVCRSQCLEVLHRRDTNEVARGFVPVREHMPGARTAGKLRVALHQSLHEREIRRLGERGQLDERAVAAPREVARAVEHEGE